MTKDFVFYINHNYSLFQNQIHYKRWLLNWSRCRSMNVFDFMTSNMQGLLGFTLLMWGAAGYRDIPKLTTHWFVLLICSTDNWMFALVEWHAITGWKFWCLTRTHQTNILKDISMGKGDYGGH